jgi:hypothetical protein
MKEGRKRRPQHFRHLRCFCLFFVGWLDERHWHLWGSALLRSGALMRIGGVYVAWHIPHHEAFWHMGSSYCLDFNKEYSFAYWWSFMICVCSRLDRLKADDWLFLRMLMEMDMIHPELLQPTISITQLTSRCLSKYSPPCLTKMGRIPSLASLAVGLGRFHLVPR